MMQAYWPIFVAALVIALFLVFWLIARASKPTSRARRPDVLDEGAAPAQRNQALIDTPPAAAMAPAPIVPPPVVPPAAGTFAGIAEVIAHGARDEIETSLPVDAAETPSEAVADPIPAETDDLRRIKGLGPKLVTTLHALGVTRFAQIAAWTDADLDDLDTKLGAFAGRPRRDAWVEQASLLAGDDTAAYEARFGKL